MNRATTRYIIIIYACNIASTNNKVIIIVRRINIEVKVLIKIITSLIRSEYINYTRFFWELDIKELAKIIINT